MARRHGSGSAQDREPEGGAADRQRLDKWLVYARFAKTRTISSELIENGRVRVNGARVTSPARGLAVGDVLTLALPHAVRVIRVTGVAERRGSFPDAQTLYEDVSG
ncbi:heat-shock protein Hsp15 [Alsobacter metallidurans]|uniref:Heat-shock protein Hsp15 n=1 Tax=Alsobacter metallidurans TaxID=340221 RepID=A0A917IA09_9HYPH|nr:RNA-binding S4 domain-containing protein [Alsobacter metallidurans]GGH31479.1 heat-shock protein Hsp15 [Alsobacter metallidurans]